MNENFVSARISEDMYDKILDLGLSKTEVVQKALEYFLNQHSNDNVNTCIHTVNEKELLAKYSNIKNEITARIVSINRYLETRKGKKNTIFNLYFREFLFTYKKILDFLNVLEGLSVL